MKIPGERRDEELAGRIDRTTCHGDDKKRCNKGQWKGSHTVNEA